MCYPARGDARGATEAEAAMKDSSAMARARAAARVLAFALAAAGAGCAAAPPVEGERAATPAEESQDPFEPFNRAMFRFNLVLDRYALEPAARAYAGLVPPGVREAVHNVLLNVELPVSAANALLQEDATRAAQALGRFAINATFGLGGAFDPAGAAGLDYVDEDFGQTLAVWGIGSGPYLVLPAMGPTTARGASGRVADIFLDPASYALNRAPGFARPVFVATNIIDRRAQGLEAFAAAARDTLDLYAAVRSGYLQRRKDLIFNGAPPNGERPPHVLEDEFNDPFLFILEDDLQ